MKKILLITLIALSASATFSQAEDRGEQAERVKAMIAGFGKLRPKITVLTRNLIVVKGKISGVGSDYFGLKVPRGGRVMPYSAVLAIEGGEQSLNFIPHEETRDYGSWDDVASIFPNTKILVLYSDGKSARGFSNSATSSHLIMIDDKGRERVDVPRDKILAVYGLIGGYGGIKAGASKGSEAMHAGRDKLLGGVFTGIGALLGMVKSEGRPILVYSR